MTKRTYEKDGLLVELASDLEYIVKDKRVCWRATHQKLQEDKGDIKKDLMNYGETNASL